MKGYKSVLSLILTVLMFEIVNGQDLPIIMPETPVAAVYNRYGQIPVDISTGVPNISIPIYTLTSKKLEVPISISYHASGVKVNDVSSAVGLGWKLNAGGVMTATIMGERDPPFTNSVLTPDYSNLNDNLYLSSDEIDDKKNEAYQNGSESIKDYAYNLANHSKAYSNNFIDQYSDRYYYSLSSGESGIFRRNFSSDEYYTIPFSTLKIDASSSDNVNIDFEITSDDGTSHYFKKPTTLGDTYYIDKIISEDKMDTINFYTRSLNGYQNDFSIKQVKKYEYFDIDNNGQPSRNLYPDPGYHLSNYALPVTNHFNEIITDSIVCTNTVIKFLHNDDRQDYGSIFKYRLDKIQVIDRTSRKLIKEITFNQTYFGTAGENNARLRLDSILVDDKSYSFKYNDKELPSYPMLVTPYYTERKYNVDFWGYLNGDGIGDKKEIPYPFSNSDNGQYMFPNENFAKASILEEISYPTGGRTVFEFESNRVDPSFYDFESEGKPTDGIVGGLRIKRISNFTADGEAPQIKEYEYSVDIPSQKLNKYVYNVKRNDVIKHLYYFYQLGNFTYWQIFDTSDEFNYSTPLIPYIGNGQVLFYSEVTEFQGTQTNNTGKIVYSYKKPSIVTRQPIMLPSPQINKIGLDNGVLRPLLWQKKIYKLEEGLYIPVQQLNNTYATFKNDRFQTGLNLFFGYEFEEKVDPNVTASVAYLYGSPMAQYVYCDSNNGENGQGPCYPYEHQHSDDFIDYFDYDDTEATTAIDLIIQEDVKFYDESGIDFVNKITEYKYNGLNHIYPTELVVYKSDGKAMRTEYEYPFDDPSNPISEKMVDLNMVSVPIKTSQYIDYDNTDTFLQSNRTEYDEWSTIYDNWGIDSDEEINIIRPRREYFKKGSNGEEPIIEYNSYYDYGKIKEVSKTKGIHTVYIWGYQEQYPIAKIENATFSEVTLAIGNLPAAYDTLLEIQSLSDTDDDRTVDTIELNGTITYEEDEGALRSALADLRNSLPDAMVTTYTYDPLVGVTSITDPKGYTTYYDYDDFGRLNQVIDADGHILSKNEYNYKP